MSQNTPRSSLKTIRGNTPLEKDISVSNIQNYPREAEKHPLLPDSSPGSNLPIKNKVKSCD